MASPQLLQFTNSAIEHMKSLVHDKTPEPLGIRITLKTRGCSGLQWEMEYATEKSINKFDEQVSIEGIKVFVDPKAILYIIGTVVDYEETDIAKGFVFKNPNEKSQCGCGESFNV